MLSSVYSGNPHCGRGTAGAGHQSSRVRRPAPGTSGVPRQLPLCASPARQPPPPPCLSAGRLALQWLHEAERAPGGLLAALQRGDGARRGVLAAAGLGGGACGVAKGAGGAANAVCRALVRREAALLAGLALGHAAAWRTPAGGAGLANRRRRGAGGGAGSARGAAVSGGTRSSRTLSWACMVHRAPPSGTARHATRTTQCRRRFASRCCRFPRGRPCRSGWCPPSWCTGRGRTPLRVSAGQGRAGQGVVVAAIQSSAGRHSALRGWPGWPAVAANQACCQAQLRGLAAPRTSQAGVVDRTTSHFQLSDQKNLRGKGWSGAARGRLG